MENNDKNFLHSAEWRKFQESVGRKTFFIENANFSASLIEHDLPIVGKYFYCPRGPIVRITNQKSQIMNEIQKLITLAKKEGAGWIRIDPENEEILNLIKENIKEIRQRRTEYKIIKAPHDMQPKEIFVIDITKSEAELLAEMKPKTRYNINLAKKKGVMVKIQNSNDKFQNKYIENFLRLTGEMALRQGIQTHPENYYRKMFETIPLDILKLYVAEYEEKIIATNLMVFYGDTATYLHGASNSEYRNIMAPYLLHWQVILDAKNMGYKYYDFGGISTNHKQPTTNTWAGITKFKLGFSPNTRPIVLPGSYDIIINPRIYLVYKGLQKAKRLLTKTRK